METENRLLKVLLSNQFFQANKSKLSRDLFPDQIKTLYDTIADSHEKYERDLSVDEVRALFRANNPTLPRAAKNQIEELLTDVAECEPFGDDVAADVLHQTWRQELGRKLADRALAYMEGGSDVGELEQILEQVKGGAVPDTGVVPVESGLEDIIKAHEYNGRWKFNIDLLSQAVPGCGEGNFIVVLARPEVGKTGFWVSLACAPEGWCQQGANVHAIVNEEPGSRTIARCVSAATGAPFHVVKENPDVYREAWDGVRSNLTVVDATDFSISDLDTYCRDNQPDIVVLDQLDKLSISGNFQRQDEALEALYGAARQIAKRHGVLIVAITQASYEAEGRSQVTYAMSSGSRTGKGAEADVVIGIGIDTHSTGSRNPHDIPSRELCLSKNKLGGDHSHVTCMFDRSISTYRN